MTQLQTSSRRPEIHAHSGAVVPHANQANLNRHRSARFAQPRLYVWWVLTLACATAVHHHLAFVSNRNGAGTPRRWILVSDSDSRDPRTTLPATKTIPYFLGANGFSRTNTQSELNAIRASFDQWQSIPGSSLRFEEMGVIPGSVDINPSDQTNLVFWATDNLLINGERDSLFGTLSLTFPRVNPDNVLLEGDIVLNGVQFEWFTDFDHSLGESRFVESSVLHEIGHFIGLEHSPSGGSTLFARGAGGVNAQAGLSSDEIAAARWLYPGSDNIATGGTIQGRVFKNGTGVHGAVVVAEDKSKNLISATVSRIGGAYELHELAAGIYDVRATPLDPPSNNSLTRLVTGGEISTAFLNSDTQFFPSTNYSVLVEPSQTNRIDLEVAPGTPELRISRLLPPAEIGAPFTAINAPISVHPGLSNRVIGVYSPNSFSSEVTFSILGDDLSLGSFRTISDVFPGLTPSLNLVSALMNVSIDATPGLRSIILQDGREVAYANGFLEIVPPVPDSDFDGLDDRFQRRYFTPFTVSDADPESDPDEDGHSNLDEYQAATDPTDSVSLLQIQRVVLTESGSVVSWQSSPGKVYQLLSRQSFNRESWEPVGTPIVAVENTTELKDPRATHAIRFYRVRLVR